jgi:hypothetical protein
MGGAALNLGIDALMGETDMITVFDDFNGVITNETGSGTTHWETLGWVLTAIGVQTATEVGMNDIDDVSEGDAGVNMQLDRINSTTPIASGNSAFPHIWIPENTTATVLDNTLLVFACRIGLVPEGATLDGKAFIGWAVAGDTGLMTAATGALTVAGAGEQLLGFHINADSNDHIAGISQRVGTTAYAEGTNFTELFDGQFAGLTAGTPIWYDLALRARVLDWSETAGNGFTEFFYRPVNSMTGIPGDSGMPVGDSVGPWVRHPTVLTDQIPNHTVALVPTIEVLNGPAGGEMDMYVDWWAFGQSRWSRS